MQYKPCNGNFWQHKMCNRHSAVCRTLPLPVARKFCIDRLSFRAIFMRERTNVAPVSATIFKSTPLTVTHR